MIAEIINNIFLWLQLLSGIISWIMFVLIIYLAIKTDFWQKKIYNVFIGFRRIPEVAVEHSLKVNKEWSNIVKRLDSGDEANYKLAVIEADKLIDTVLKNLTIPGSTMGERLKAIPVSQLPSIDNVWQVHKLRNHLVHTTEFVLTENKAKQAITIYQQALNELKVL
ncbi:MAG: hypothetical protein WD512_10865 [Candidatus Paceibacterota bacterium]